jgi:Na+-translocating ferredoxin:NAD+ oxidoreductase RNF subunit RnfB
MTAVIAMALLAFVLAAMLAMASRRLSVREDPRLEIAEGLLPGNNCGACGYPGCRAFAEAMLQEQAQPGQCTVATAEAREAVGALLGITVRELEPRVARLACAGGTNVAHTQARYLGIATCRAAATVAGGGRACTWGCLGFGDCEAACDFDAIHMNRHGLPVVDEAACTACADCVRACPKDLFSIHPLSHRLWVACRSLEVGDAVLEACSVGCNGCGRCAVDAPGVVSMVDGLAVVDHAAVPAREAIERCPTGAIVWLDPDGRTVKGRAARRVVRKTPLEACA